VDTVVTGMGPDTVALAVVMRVRVMPVEAAQAATLERPVMRRRAMR
jgi:hypothetical protein